MKKYTYIILQARLASYHFHYQMLHIILTHKYALFNGSRNIEHIALIYKMIIELCFANIRITAWQEHKKQRIIFTIFMISYPAMFIH